jgi:hypothetical protein
VDEQSTQVPVIQALTEGLSIRATVRITGVAKDTVTKLLVSVGNACAEYHDRNVRHVHARRIQCDEIWQFCYAKAKNIPPDTQGQFGFGGVWTWVAIDADTKLVPCFMVGRRDLQTAKLFIDDLAGRLANRVQLTTDGLRACVGAMLYRGRSSSISSNA